MTWIIDDEVALGGRELHGARFEINFSYSCRLQEGGISVATLFVL